MCCKYVAWHSAVSEKCIEWKGRVQHSCYHGQTHTYTITKGRVPKLKKAKVWSLTIDGGE